MNAMDTTKDTDKEVCARLLSYLAACTTYQSEVNSDITCEHEQKAFFQCFEEMDEESKWKFYFEEKKRADWVG